jgi:hypothetical protein
MTPSAQMMQKAAALGLEFLSLVAESASCVCVVFELLSPLCGRCDTLRDDVLRDQRHKSHRRRRRPPQECVIALWPHPVVSALTAKPNWVNLLAIEPNFVFAHLQVCKKISRTSIPDFILMLDFLIGGFFSLFCV